MTEESQSNLIRLVVAEDHEVVRQGFVALINDEDDLEVCAEAENAKTTLEAIRQTDPDMLIMDLILDGEDGVELIKQLKALYPKLPVLVISMQDEQVWAERVLRAGAKGYIMKNKAAEEFMDAIHAVMKGEIYVSQKMNIRLLQRLIERPALVEEDPVSSLSDRELHTYQLIGSGLPTRRIAEEMKIRPKTVESYKDNIKIKLNLPDARALAQSAEKWVEEHQG